MSAWISNSFVALAVLASAVYAAWFLAPKAWRERLRVRLARHIPMLRLYGHLGPQFASGRKPVAGLGGCPDCGTCEPPRDSQLRS